MTNKLSLRDALAMMWSISVSTFTLPPSTLFRSHRVEISEHGLDGLAPAVRTKGVRSSVLSDALPALKDRSTFLASEFIGRHDEDLQAGMSRAGSCTAARQSSVYATTQHTSPSEPSAKFTPRTVSLLAQLQHPSVRLSHRLQAARLGEEGRTIEQRRVQIGRHPGALDLYPFRDTRTRPGG